MMTSLQNRLAALVLTSSLWLHACHLGGDEPGGPTSSNAGSNDGDPGGTGGKGPSIPKGYNVVWKRAGAVQRDLMRALDLPKSELCNELGSLPCIDTHIAFLGGNEPFSKNQYTRIQAPSSVTPMVLDRIVMGACLTRVEKDRAGEPKVFKSLNLNRPALPADDTFLRSLDAQHVDLFRRLLSRDPSADELAELRSLATNAEGAPISAAELGVLSCFVIGTHAESVFL